MENRNILLLILSRFNMTMFENFREDRRNMREDLINALSSGKISEETVKEILQNYDNKYLEICEKLSNNDMNKYYELEQKRLEIYSHPKSFGESVYDFAESFARGAETISNIKNNNTD